MPRSRPTRIAAMLLAGAAVLSVVGGCTRQAAQTPAADVSASESSATVSLTATYAAGDLLVTLAVPRLLSTEVTAPASLTLTNRSGSVSVVRPFLWRVNQSGPCMCSGSTNPPAWRDRKKETVDLSPGESLELTYTLRPHGPGVASISPKVDTSSERRGLLSTPVTVTVQ